jgi:tetratricopeptide (TPR) repeat protein
MKAYLQRHLFDGERLRRFALEEFVKAIRSGRLIAFVGSYATQDLGYDEWSDFLRKYVEAAQAILKKEYGEAPSERRAHRANKAIKSLSDSLAEYKSNSLAALSIIESALGYASTPEQNLLKQFEEESRAFFNLDRGGASWEGGVPHLLITELGVDRIITLNYDLEFEWLLMLTADERKVGSQRQGEFEKRVPKTEDALSRVRILPSGRSVTSDVFSRDRTDYLVEFAVGSPDYESHILHLHGRVTDPETMVVSLRDYNRQYRRSGVTKLPFEHALKVLFAGNPILFVGVGMTEIEITATLEQFVSDHPNRRITPAFIIWNSPFRPERKDAHRFAWLHRFGVLTLFDDELSDDPALTSLSDALRFRLSITNLARQAKSLMELVEWVPEDFRSIAGKFTRPDNLAAGHFDLWSRAAPNVYPPAAASLDDVIDGPSPVQVLIGSPGAGKGAVAQQIRKGWHERPNPAGNGRRSVVVSATFAFEVASVFSLISGLENGTTAAEEGISRRQAILQFLLNAAANSPELLIVINGMERFFAPTGAPLSNELDTLLRLATMPRAPASTASAGAPRFRLVLLGTNRVQTYFHTLRPNSQSINYTRLPLASSATYPSVYFESVSEKFGKRGFDPNSLTTTQRIFIERKKDGDRTDLRRSFLGAYLQTDALLGAGALYPDLCLDILMVMAFIGQPIEDEVVFHAPRIRKRLSAHAQGSPKSGAAAMFTQALSDLQELGLIIELTPFEGSPSDWRRFGLHRSVLAELRDRMGVPLSDASLSGGFNLSLYAAQPAEGYSPEAEIHEELESLVDWLIGAYKDKPLHPNTAIKRAALTRKKAGEGVGWYGRKGWAHVSACLRAALAIMRNYYSTAALLALDLGKGDSDDRDAPLTEHGERLERLLKAASENASARRDLRRRLKTGADDLLGPAPFYPDDLVWLNNERGTVKLTQGDLYEARHSLEEAIRFNDRYVEFGDRGPNWRRLMLNQLHADVERARLDRAERRIADIERAVDEELPPSARNQVREILLKYGKHDSAPLPRVDDEFEHDVILTVGLTTAYRGLCAHLKGELRTASLLFEKAVNIFQNIGEQRAYALFQRHHGLLKEALYESKDETLAALNLAIASAEATRQTDIAYSSRVSWAWHSHTPSAEPKRPELLRRLQRALDYAERADMHRVRVEADLNLALVKLEGGDYDAALERAADAMATATRYGMSLRKIGLRILMGQILIRRGDPLSGQALIERAIRSADRVGYQGAVGLAQRVRATEGLPPTSALS